MSVERNLTLLLRGLLLFWALWLTVVVVTNVLDLLQTCAWISQDFKFVSGNASWIRQVMQPLGVSAQLQTSFYCAAILWEAVAAGLFWRALFCYRGRSLSGESATLLALGVNLALWGAFQVLDEVFLAYQPEAVHRVIFANVLLTLILFVCCRLEQRTL